jgi:phospho-N-acetylmuramoyl-pentapeptide-transferase
MTEPFFQIIRLLIVAGISFALAMALEPVMEKLLLRFRLGKQIRTEGAPVFAQLHARKAGTPTMGGILIWLTVTVVIFGFAAAASVFDRFWFSLSFLSRPQTYLPLGMFLLAGLIGALDDLMGILRIGPKGGGLRVRDKIILYLLVAGIGAWWFADKLEWDILRIPFFGDFAIGFWYVPLFIFVIAAAAFSLYVTDGLDGLAGGVSLIALASLAVVAFTQQRFDLAVFLGSIIGALLAFLWFNIYPARFFMGDTGSMALGVLIGVVSMLTNSVLFLPFFGFILVVESLSVILQTISKRAFKTKLFISTPIHHHFEARGWPESQVTMRFWIASAMAAAVGLILFFLDRLLR